MTPISVKINPKGMQARFILEQLRDRIQSARHSKNRADARERWIDAEDRAVAYLPERTVDTTRDNTRRGGKPQYTTIQVPYTFAVMMSAHTYMTSVYLSRTPVLQFTARHGEPQMQVQGIEALMDYQAQVAHHLVMYHQVLYDMSKFGFGVLGNYWDEEVNVVSEIVEQEELFLGMLPTGKMKKVTQRKEIPGFKGNKIFVVRPYDFYHDPRVPITRMQDGEFCGVYVETNWNRLWEGQLKGRYVNVENIRPKSQGRWAQGSISSSDREEGSPRGEIADTQDFGSSNVEKGTAADIVRLYEVYVEIIPQDWGLGKSQVPEKWVFTATEKFEHLIEARPAGAYHNKFPYSIYTQDPDAYRVFPRGYPDLMKPIQQTVDWLLNTHFYNVRKALNNKYVVDPSRMVMGDFKNEDPGGFLRLRPAAYGQDLRQFFQQLPIQDVTQNHLRDMQVVMQLGERVSGINDALMGMQSPSSRRSAAEVRSSNGFGINRLKTGAEFSSALGMTQNADMMLANTQQFLDVEMKVRLVGDLVSTGDMAQFVAVNPENIAGFYDFVPVDGTLPVDRFAQANLWRELMAQMRNFPQILMEYDVGKIFSYVAQLTGLKNINQFKIEVISDEDAARQAAAGNIVPLGGGGEGGGARRVTDEPPRPRQISGLGE